MRKIKVNNDIDVRVGLNLKIIRLRADKTQEAVGLAAGVGFQQIHKYETGANGMRASKLYVIAKFLNVEIKDFFKDMQNTQTPPAKTVIDKINREMNILKMFNSLAYDELREGIVNLLNDLNKITLK